tara:strand:- start:19037 stop:19678 length:642 start_codon:yes stop_codon:yes gene_type:complete
LREILKGNNGLKIVGFAGSSSRESINKKLVKHVSSFFDPASVELLDLNDFEVDIFSVDKERDGGIPNKISELASAIDNADLLLVSLAEHNGSYSAAFKNIYDWLSRIPGRKVFGEKPVFLMATSPGGRGGASVLAAAQDRFPRDGSEIVESFSLPGFNKNFKDGEITEPNIGIELHDKINKIKCNKFNWFFKDDSSTCGIDPSKDECGDAIEY